MAMRPPSSRSFFGGLRARELSGGRGASAARLHYLSDLSSDPGGRGGGVISVEHSGDPAIPFAVSFCKVKSLPSHGSETPLSLFFATLRFGAADRALIDLSPHFRRRRKSLASWPSRTRTAMLASTTPGGASPPDPRH
jgi:hypothetical protein